MYLCCINSNTTMFNIFFSYLGQDGPNYRRKWPKNDQKCPKMPQNAPKMPKNHTFPAGSGSKILPYTFFRKFSIFSLQNIAKINNRIHAVALGLQAVVDGWLITFGAVIKVEDDCR